MACCDTCGQGGHFTAAVDARLQASANLAAKWPRTTKVLADYARSRISSGRPFYVSHYFNSTVLNPPKGFGLFIIDDIVAAAAAVAGAIGSIAGPAASIAAVVNTVKGQATASPGGSGITADSIAAAILPNVQAQLTAKGIALPSSVAHQATSAAILDAFGPQYHNLVLYGGLALGALVAFKLIKG